MSHEIFQSRYFGDRPAWHGLGVVTTTPMSAQEAWQLLPPYQVSVDPLVTRSDRLPTGWKAIRCGQEIYAIVSSRYVLVKPEDMVEIYDQHIRRPVATMAALKKGMTFLISTRLPDYDVNGDPVENYLVIVDTMDGKTALRGMITPVRVVCQNTLITGLAEATEYIRLPHLGDPKGDLAKWAEEAVQSALARSQALREAFELLAKTRVKDAKPVLEQVYPLPQDATDKVRERVLNTRQVVHMLYDGLAKGSESFKGTGWGLYNAVVEYEDHYRKVRARGAYQLLGSAPVKARAMEVILSLN